MNGVFQNIFKLEVEKMIKESEYIEPLRHKGVKGTIRELALTNLLKKFLPSYCQVGNGEIHDWMGNKSNETDLIIYDKNILPPILFDTALGVFPVESVVYAIEVKTKSTKKELTTSINKFDNLKKLKSKYFYGIRRVYFAYKSNLNNKNELERYAENDNIWDPSISIICVAGDGYYFYNSIDICKYQVYKSEGWQEYKGSKLIQWVGMKANNNYEIIIFIAGVLNTTRDISIGNYVLNEGEFDIYCEAILNEDNNIIYKKINYEGIPKGELVKIIKEA